MEMNSELVKAFNTAVSTATAMVASLKEEVQNQLSVLYKDATDESNTPNPSLLKTNDGECAMPRDEAMRKYVEIVNSLCLQEGQIPCLGSHGHTSIDTQSSTSRGQFSTNRDFLFCHLCGTMLTFSATYAECPFCKTRTSLEGSLNKEISYSMSAEEIRRSLGMSNMEEETPQLPKINQKCERCGHNEAFFHSKQIRSGSKGQTTFYTCTSCSHQFQGN